MEWGTEKSQNDLFCSILGLISSPSSPSPIHLFDKIMQERS